MCQDTRLGLRSGSCLACGRSFGLPFAPGREEERREQQKVNVRFENLQILEEHDVQELLEGPSNTASPFYHVNALFQNI